MALQEITVQELMDALGFTNQDEVDKIIAQADEIGLPEWKPLAHHHPDQSVALNPSIEKAFNAMEGAVIANDTAEIVQSVVEIPESDLGVPLALTAIVEHFNNATIAADPEKYAGNFAAMMTLFLAGYYYAKDNANG